MRQQWLSLKRRQLIMYSKTSVARTLMPRLPGLFRSRSLVPRKKTLAGDLG